MAIARMFVRSGLLTIALMSGIATAKAICRFTFRLDGKPERTRPQRCAVDLGRDLARIPCAAILQVSSSVTSVPEPA